MKIHRSKEQQAAAQRGEIDAVLCREIRTDEWALHSFVEAMVGDVRNKKGRPPEETNRYVLQTMYTLLLAVGQGARRFGFPLPEVLAVVEAGWATDKGVH